MWGLLGSTREGSELRNSLGLGRGAVATSTDKDQRIRASLSPWPEASQAPEDNLVGVLGRCGKGFPGGY